jgi:hypothetical protein
MVFWDVDEDVLPIDFPNITCNRAILDFDWSWREKNELAICSMDGTIQVHSLDKNNAYYSLGHWIGLF